MPRFAQISLLTFQKREMTTIPASIAIVLRIGNRSRSASFKVTAFTTNHPVSGFFGVRFSEVSDNGEPAKDDSGPVFEERRPYWLRSKLRTGSPMETIDFLRRLEMNPTRNSPSGGGVNRSASQNFIEDVRHVSSAKQDNDRRDMRPEDQRNRDEPKEQKGESLRSKFSNVMVGPEAA